MVKAQNIVVNEASDVQILMDRYTADNRMSEYVDGWRIQIVSSTAVSYTHLTLPTIYSV